jgi:hypothetical protein
MADRSLHLPKRCPLSRSNELWVVVSHGACLQKHIQSTAGFHPAPPTKLWLAVACATARTIPSRFISKLVGIFISHVIALCRKPRLATFARRKRVRGFGRRPVPRLCHQELLHFRRCLVLD